MSRLLKFLLIGLAAVLVLMLGIAVAVLLLFDPNDYRDEIAAEVETRTGRTFSIDGELGLRVLPCCAVAIDDTRLGNPPGFDDPDFASVRAVRLGLQLWPLLLERRVVIDEVTLDGLDVKLLRRADGTANWTFDGNEEAAAEAEEETADATVEPLELSVAGVNITDAAIEFRDAAEGTHVIVEDLDVQSGPVAVGEPVDIDVSLTARDVPSQASVTAAFGARLRVTEDLSQAELMDMDAKADIAGPDLPAATVAMRATALRADLDSGAVEVNDVVSNITTAGVRLDIVAKGRVAAEQTALTGTLAVPEFSPREVLAELGQPPVETADPAVLGEMELVAVWSLNGERLEVTDLSLRLDDSSVTGTLGTRLGSQAATQFNVAVDVIDLDRYAAPAPESEQSTGGGTGEGSELPSDALRDLDVDGLFTIGQLTMGGLTLQNVVAKLTAKNGLLRIDPSTADVYGGRYEGALQLDVRGDVPQVSFMQTLNSVQAGGMLADLYDTDNLQGLLQASFNGSGSGRTTTELMRGLQGSVALDLDDAVYKGADVWYEIRKSVARIKGKPSPKAPADPQTQITALGFAGQLADGILRSDQLVGEIPFIRVEGTGAFDLLDNQLDYRLRARMLSRPTFPDADDLADLERVTIPITVTGDATAPTIGIDLEELAKDAAVQKVQDRLLKKLGIDEPAATEGEPTGGDTGSNATDQQPDSRDEARDALKKGLRDLLDR